MKIAAIDIGSNAIRLQVTNVIEYKGKVTFKKIEYLRFPLRLGYDVFMHNKIGEINEDKFIRLMQAFKILLDLYEVDDYMACATSAMRDSENGHEIVENVKNKINLNIEIIDGEKEAEMTNRAIVTFIDEKPYLHIDVGGGSTELNVYVEKEKIATNSFRIGSVRRLQKTDSPEVWEEMYSWIKQNVNSRFKKITAIGTGGNINKIFELANKPAGKKVSFSKVQEIKNYIEDFSLDERINFLQLNPDRADVIVPASEIYLTVMKWGRAGFIYVPDMGLKDGMMQIMYERSFHKVESE